MLTPRSRKSVTSIPVLSLPPVVQASMIARTMGLAFRVGV